MNHGNGNQLVGGIPYNPPYEGARTATEKRETVQSALDYHQNAIGQLHSMITELETRLVAVLEPLPPAGGNANAPPAPQPTSVLVRVTDATRSIETASRRLGELVQRIQL